ncbi:MAG: hydrogenase maturation protease [Elusimicrobiota bacterium]
MSREIGAKPTLLLALGNDILGDDGVGLVVAERLKDRVGEGVEILATSESGFRVMEFLEGYDNALLIDSVSTGQNPPGTVLEFTREAFARIKAPSPHYAGMSEVFELADRLGLTFPKNFRVLAMEIVSPKDFSVGLSPEVERAIPGLVERAGELLLDWEKEKGAPDA